MRIYNVSSYGLTLNECKDYLKVEVANDDTIISSLITASYEQVTAETGQYFTPTTCSMTMFSSSGDIFLSTQTVDYVSTGSLKEVDGSWYTYIDQSYSGAITFHLGKNRTPPQNVKVAQMMLTAWWYEQRVPMAVGVSATPLDFSVSALLSPYKLVKPQ